MKIIYQDFIVDLEDPIGEGQYGQVYFCQQKGNPELLAAKIFKRFDDQTQKELENLEKASKSSEYVVKYITHFFEDKKCILVTEYCEQTLESYINQLGGRMPENLAQKYFIELLKALRDIDAIGLMHRDIKIENLFIKNNVLKLGDFGFSTNDKFSDQVIGTPLYMDPNMIKADLDGRSYIYNKTVDVWSSGIVLFQMVYGYYPFKIEYTKDFDTNLKLLIEKINSIDTSGFLDSQNIKISKDLKELLMNILVIKQDKRWTYKVIQNSTWIQKGALRYNQQKENEALLVDGNLSNVSITMSMLGFQSVIKRSKQINKKLIKAYFLLRNYFNDQNYRVKFHQIPIKYVIQLQSKLQQLLRSGLIKSDTYEFQLNLYITLFLIRVMLIDIFQKNINYIQESREISKLLNVEQQVAHEILNDLCCQEFELFEKTFIQGEKVYLKEKELLLKHLQNKNQSIYDHIKELDKQIQLSINTKTKQSIIKNQLENILDKLKQDIEENEYQDMQQEFYQIIYGIYKISEDRLKTSWTIEYEKYENFSEFDIKLQAKDIIKQKKQNLISKNQWIKENIGYVIIILILAISTLYSILR